MKTHFAAASMVVLSFAARPGFAQPAPAALDEIIVTGTRSSTRTVTTSLAPIDVLSSAALEKSGRTSTRDMISALAPSANTSNAGAGASFAVKTVSLRGLAADQTLVLVNGKRRHNTAILFANGATQNGQSPPDLDLIPASAIERIEVLRDGASAQYGSDALAGVINIILKGAKTGGGASVMGGITGEGDGEVGQVSLNNGFAFAREGFLNLTFDAKTQNYTDRGSKTPNTTLLYARVNGANDPREATVNRLTSHPGSPALQLYSLGYSAGVSLNEAVKLYSFGTIASRNSAAFLTFRNPNSLNNITAVYPDGYTPRLFLKDRDFQVTGGAKGDGLFGLRWDASTSVSRDEVSYFENSLNASLGPASPTYFDLGKLTFEEWTSNLDLTREFDTGVFAKPLFVAAGVEYRRDKFILGVGQLESYVNGNYRAPAGTPLAGQVTSGGSQGVTGFPPSSVGKFARNNTSAYINLEQSLASNWEISLAGRYEDYSDFGEAKTAKISTRYEPLRGVAVRGTASTGFRAPSLQQEHYGSSGTIGVSFPTGTVLYPVELLPPDTPAAVALGAKPLQPETSTNYSVGLILQPVTGMNITLDAYQIKIKDRVLLSGALGPSPVVSNALAAQGLNPQQAVLYFANAADTTAKGLDLVADYLSGLGSWGSVTWTLSANFNKSTFDRVVPPPPALAAAGLVLIDRIKIGDFTVGTPQDKQVFSADWTWGKLETVGRVTRYGRVIQRTTNPANDEILAPAGIIDLYVSYSLFDNVKLSAGANNLLNHYPDVTKVENRGAPAFSYYNPYSPYGISGGFYYAKAVVTF